MIGRSGIVYKRRVSLKLCWLLPVRMKEKIVGKKNALGLLRRREAIN